MREQLPTILKMEPTKLQNWTDDAPFLTLSSFLLYVSLSCPVFILFFLVPSFTRKHREKLSHSRQHDTPNSLSLENRVKLTDVCTYKHIYSSV